MSPNHVSQLRGYRTSHSAGSAQCTLRAHTRLPEMLGSILGIATGAAESVRFIGLGAYRLNHYRVRAPTRDPSRDSPGAPGAHACALGWRSPVLARCQQAYRYARSAPLGTRHAPPASRRTVLIQPTDSTTPSQLVVGASGSFTGVRQLPPCRRAAVS